MSIDGSTALAQGVRALGLDIDLARQQRLLDYMALLMKWNRVYNLTAVRDPQEILTHHLLDSLSALPPLLRHAQGRPMRVLDVGSGGGLPGVVWAICRPEWEVTCVDAVAKKTAFIQQASGTLALPHLKAVHARVETLTETWPVIVSRAFASLADFTLWTDAALAQGGQWLAMKGKRPDAEMAELPASIDVFHVEPLTVPGLEAERCLVWMRRAEV
ncbi:MAG: 16S rRNA (guanine(527)-N(7))-methyltransferase RsmG [Alphaproteobacteria bacterium]|nr:16S rRNA (guanine(527)-N(7))-methyltransferase RsmG [Alphaproteobacteria bacterium]